METIEVKLINSVEPLYISGEDLNVDIEEEEKYTLVTIRDDVKILLITPFDNLEYILSDIKSNDDA